jgi:hypothetical protein
MKYLILLKVWSELKLGVGKIGKLGSLYFEDPQLFTSKFLIFNYSVVVTAGNQLFVSRILTGFLLFNLSLIIFNCSVVLTGSLPPKGKILRRRQFNLAGSSLNVEL